MNPETLAVARSAWKAMTRKPSILDAITGQSAMPAAVAVDMVQDVTDDRGAAILAIVSVGADELHSTIPAARSHADSVRDHATAAVDYLRSLAIGEAEAHVDVVAEEFAFPAVGDLMRAHLYRLWTAHAYQVINWCREVGQLWPANDQPQTAESAS